MGEAVGRQDCRAQEARGQPVQHFDANQGELEYLQPFYGYIWGVTGTRMLRLRSACLLRGLAMGVITGRAPPSRDLLLQAFFSLFFPFLFF